MSRLITVLALIAGSVIGCSANRPARLLPDSAAPACRPPSDTPFLPRQAPQLGNPPRYTGSTWFPAGRSISPRWTTIVIHHSATARGNARAFDRSHRDKGWDELGYHFVIGNGSDTPDGLIEVGSRWHKQKHGAHCKTPGNYYNEHGIGICLVGDFTKTRPTNKQLASLYELVRFLSVQLNIPPERITTHGLVKSGTQCPGKYFALAPLRNFIATPTQVARAHHSL